MRLVPQNIFECHYNRLQPLSLVTLEPHIWKSIRYHEWAILTLQNCFSQLFGHEISQGTVTIVKTADGECVYKINTGMLDN